VQGGPSKVVALLTGAWIETLRASLDAEKEAQSRSSRARGLKPGLERLLGVGLVVVALFTGAWIET